MVEAASCIGLTISSHISFSPRFLLVHIPYFGAANLCGFPLYYEALLVIMGRSAGNTLATLATPSASSTVVVLPVQQ